jgi:hypothetical protein
MTVLDGLVQYRSTDTARLGVEVRVEFRVESRTLSGSDYGG